MRLIADDDYERIRLAHDKILAVQRVGFPAVLGLIEAKEALADVLEHIHQLGQERPYQMPQIPSAKVSP